MDCYTLWQLIYTFYVSIRKLIDFTLIYTAVSKSIWLFDPNNN